MKNKGIVVKVKDSYCIILSGDGLYQRVPLSRVKNPRVGAESEFSPANWVDRIKPLLMVASLLVFVLGLNMFRMASAQVPAAYVSLDINPSVELAVDRQMKVLEITALNQDAQKLLTGMELINTDLYTALHDIMEKAAQSGYVRTNQKNYVLSAVTPNHESQNLVNYNNIALKIEEAVEDKNLDVELVILTGDLKVRNEAKNQGVSSGKMLVYKNSIESGEKTTVQQIKNSSITQLINTKQIKLIANGKKLLVKKMHIVPDPPGQLKKGSTEDLPEDTVEQIDKVKTGTSAKNTKKSTEKTNKKNQPTAQNIEEKQSDGDVLEEPIIDSQKHKEGSDSAKSEEEESESPKNSSDKQTNSKLETKNPNDSDTNTNEKKQTKRSEPKKQ